MEEVPVDQKAVHFTLRLEGGPEIGPLAVPLLQRLQEACFWSSECECIVFADKRQARDTKYGCEEKHEHLARCSKRHYC